VPTLKSANPYRRAILRELQRVTHFFRGFVVAALRQARRLAQLGLARVIHQPALMLQRLELVVM
jgi:hypothetical protein